jgi:hypothetical protein
LLHNNTGTDEKIMKTGGQLQSYGAMSKRDDKEKMDGTFSHLQTMKSSSTGNEWKLKLCLQ